MIFTLRLPELPGKIHVLRVGPFNVFIICVICGQVLRSPNRKRRMMHRKRVPMIIACAAAALGLRIAEPRPAPVQGQSGVQEQRRTPPGTIRVRVRLVPWTSSLPTSATGR